MIGWFKTIKAAALEKITQFDWLLWLFRQSCLIQFFPETKRTRTCARPRDYFFVPVHCIANRQWKPTYRTYSSNHQII